MKIVCVGGGPAGLFFEILMKLSDENHDITIFERNPAGETYGWGVVYWDDLIEKLYANDPETARVISENSFRWADQIVHVQDRQAIHPGGHGFSISRQRLIGILAARATGFGVHVEFGREIENLSHLADAELIVAGDGAGSPTTRAARGPPRNIRHSRPQQIHLAGHRQAVRHVHLCFRGNGFRVDLVSRIWLRRRDEHVSLSAPRKHGRTSACTSPPRTRASHSWSGYSSSTSMGIR
jgi:2-polyprenyl-6-methoxyphenol hydroxylase-like FAD-dependent oxidoreductase